MNVNVLRLNKIKEKTGLSRSNIYRKVANGEFPKPISLGGKAIGWIENEINEWINGKISEREDQISLPLDFHFNRK